MVISRKRKSVKGKEKLVEDDNYSISDENSSKLTMADLMSTYPSLDNPDIQAIVSLKKEFLELRSKLSENIPSRGHYFNSQKLIKRIVDVYDRHILLARTGAGKSCSLVNIAESFINNMVDNANITRAIFVVKGKLLRAEMYKQIACSCTSKGTYDTPYINDPNSSLSTQRHRLIHLLEGRYDIITLQKFASDIARLYGVRTRERVSGNAVGNANIDQETDLAMPSTEFSLKDGDSKVIAHYSNILIFIDEFHEIRVKMKKIQEIINLSPPGSNGPDVISLKGLTSKQVEYYFMHRMAHLIKGSKFIAATATTPYDDPNETASIYNMMLPINKQIPASLDFKTITLKEFEYYARGLITHFRVPDIGVDEVYPEKSIEMEKLTVVEAGQNIQIQPNLRIYPVMMSPFQSKIYLSESGDNKNADVHWSEIQSSTFVYPDGSFGKKGFDKYVGKEGIRKELRDVLSINKKDGLEKHSAIYYDLIKRCKSVAGVHYIYMEEIKGSGGITFMYALLENGYDEFTKDYDRNRPYCPTSKLVLGPKPKKKQFAIIRSELTETQFESIREVITSPENINGEYISIVIITPVGKLGLNINHAVDISLVSGTWNLQDQRQAIARAIRVNGYIDVLRLLREKDGPDARISVPIYHYISYPRGKSPKDSIGYKMYRQAIDKDYYVMRIDRMQTQVAVNCQIDYERNLVKAKDGSSKCHYNTCKYDCFGPQVLDYETGEPLPGNKIDNSTYYIYYLDSILGNITESIKLYFKRYNVRGRASIDDMVHYFSEEAPTKLSPKILYLALNKLVDNISMLDMYGYSSYIRESSGIFYLDRDFMETPPSSLMSFYNRNLIITSSESLANLASRINMQEVSGITRALENNDNINIDEELWKLSPEAHIKWWEESYIELLSNKNLEPRVKQRLEQIVDRHKYLYLKINIPNDKIKNVRIKLKNVGKGAGRKPKDGTKPKPIKIENDTPYIEEKLDSDIKQHVVIHWLSSVITYGQSEFDVIPNWMNIAKPMRILYLGDDNPTWRNMDEIENKVYNEHAQLYTKEMVIGPFRKKGMYAVSIDPMGYNNKNIVSGYWISDRRDDMGLYSIKSARKQNRGRRCKSYKNTVDIIWYLYREMNIPPGLGASISDEFTIDLNGLLHIKLDAIKDKLINKLNIEIDDINTWTREKLIAYFGLLILINNNSRCEIIINRMKSLGLVINL